MANKPQKNIFEKIIEPSEKKIKLPKKSQTILRNKKISEKNIIVSEKKYKISKKGQNPRNRISNH